MVSNFVLTDFHGLALVVLLKYQDMIGKIFSPLLLKTNFIYFEYEPENRIRCPLFVSLLFIYN